MADKIAKFLRRLSAKDRAQVELLFMRLYAGDTEGLNIRQLVGLDDTFRVRQGRIRVIYIQVDSRIRIVKIAFRDDKTYKDL